MSKPAVLFGFHAVRARLRLAPKTVQTVYVEVARKDRRMQDMLKSLKESGVSVHTVESDRLDRMCGHNRHQGVVAQASAIEQPTSIDDYLDTLTVPPLLLILDGITDPHNLGACLRVADGAGAHAIIAPKDRSCGINATVAKVASGAADSVPYFTVTNLARTITELQERSIWVLGTTDDAPQTLYQAKLDGPLALVLGAEGEGMRRLTRERCDALISIPMYGSVESLNVSVATGVCLYEAARQRAAK
jgi:23S rRNA (guanosine2251-2'-O)-methyltransferase